MAKNYLNVSWFTLFVYCNNLVQYWLKQWLPWGWKINLIVLKSSYFKRKSYFQKFHKFFNFINQILPDYFEVIFKKKVKNKKIIEFSM